LPIPFCVDGLKEKSVVNWFLRKKKNQMLATDWLNLTQMNPSDWSMVILRSHVTLQSCDTRDPSATHPFSSFLQPFLSCEQRLAEQQEQKDIGCRFKTSE
jgi:hypothetical protein